MLTRTALDAMGCGAPGCTHDHSILYLHSLCHPSDGLEVQYVKADGKLIVACETCGRKVTDIKVATDG